MFGQKDLTADNVNVVLNNFLYKSGWVADLKNDSPVDFIGRVFDNFSNIVKNFVKDVSNKEDGADSVVKVFETLSDMQLLSIATLIFAKNNLFNDDITFISKVTNIESKDISGEMLFVNINGIQDISFEIFKEILKRINEVKNDME